MRPSLGPYLLLNETSHLEAERVEAIQRIVEDCICPEMLSQTGAGTAERDRDGLPVGRSGRAACGSRCGTRRLGAVTPGQLAGRHTCGQRVAESESRDGRLNTHRRRWGSSRARPCLEVREDAVDISCPKESSSEISFASLMRPSTR
jgi:hypothetical protein